MRRSIVFTMIAIVIVVSPSPAQAWTRPGHMAVAAIAYRELARDHPLIVDKIVTLMADHPEPGPFEVAIGRAEGRARAERIFLEIARWPDDVRRSEYDHPTWHYRFRPVIDSAAPPPAPPPYAASGSASEALALNIGMARNPRASNAERAVALCWIFHIVGDVHQPLHAAELFSSRFPEGLGHYLSRKARPTRLGRAPMPISHRRR
ncbi:hypothetical protein KRZ98_17680 [Sphingobium sp. AS12]|nr:hypothetical protein [Sphingobium sp. AS12]